MQMEGSHSRILINPQEITSNTLSMQNKVQ